MTNLLVIYSSMHGEDANSYALIEHYLDQLPADQVTVTKRDLNTPALPHLGREEFAAWTIPETERSETQKQAAALSDTIIREVEEASQIIVAAPMYNFGIPSVLKAWIDRLAHAGKTFNYTESGPKGLLGGREVIVVATRGGSYKGTETDTQTPYLKTLFSFVGIEDLTFIYAESLAQSGKKEASLNKAKQALETLAAR